MAHYRYKAINQDGRFVKDKIVAENKSELAAILKGIGLELVSCKIESEQSAFSLGANKATPRDLIATFVHLEQLDRAGVSIIDSIADLKDTSDSPQIKSLMQEIHESIKNGNLFSESLSKHPSTFSPIYVGLIATGEQTGNLSEAFSSIIDDIKWNMDIKRKTKKATNGPIFGVCMMFLVLGIMTSVVVPKVTGFLLSQNLELPVMTTSLISFSDFLKNNWLGIILFVPIVWTTLKALGRFPEIAVKMDHIKLKIPIMGSIINKLDAAKFCQFFSMTFKSGLGVLECLDAATGVIKNKAIKRSITMVKEQVSEGQSLARSIDATGYFPNLVVRMIKIGEDSGNMESSLNNIKFFYDREINDSIDKLVGMIQPTLTMVMGGMIAWITIAVFGPIYSTFSSLS